ncbi:MAG: siphovirus ReqiPepy6 Gp37-like family protein [Clostridium sp.]|uniref:siphovirus ReqiPepy6 Gp37-like family protein n=1 Tax=Clostridium sp. TaxID=1506 RepID=UPI003EE7806C
MDISVYNNVLQARGIIKGVIALQWKRKFFDNGSFDLRTTITSKNVELLAKNNFIVKSNSDEIGIIESVQTIKNSESGTSELVVKGVLAEGITKRRILLTKYSKNGLAEESIREMINTCCINPTDTKRKIPLLQLGTNNNFTEKVDFQATYKNLNDQIIKVLKVANLGFRARLDKDIKKIILEVYKGRDLSDVIRLNEVDGTLKSINYVEDISNYKNFTLVGGEGEGTARTTVTVDKGLTGLERSEIFTDARDLQKESLTTVEYQNKLKTRGEETLNTNNVSESFVSETNYNMQNTYRDYWDLGDIITVESVNLGITLLERVTEVTEEYTTEGIKIIPVFGNPEPSLKDILKEEF